MKLLLCHELVEFLKREHNSSIQIDTSELGGAGPRIDNIARTWRTNSEYKFFKPANATAPGRLWEGKHCRFHESTLSQAKQPTMYIKHTILYSCINNALPIWVCRRHLMWWKHPLWNCRCVKCTGYKVMWKACSCRNKLLSNCHCTTKQVTRILTHQQCRANGLASCSWGILSISHLFSQNFPPCLYKSAIPNCVVICCVPFSKSDCSSCGQWGEVKREVRRFSLPVLRVMPKNRMCRKKSDLGKHNPSCRNALIDLIIHLLEQRFGTQVIKEVIGF